jgi:hypothetical protein
MTYRKFAGPVKFAIRPATALQAGYLVLFVVAGALGGGGRLAAGGAPDAPPGAGGAPDAPPPGAPDFGAPDAPPGGAGGAPGAPPAGGAAAVDAAGFFCAMALFVANAIATESETSIIVVFMKRSSFAFGLALGALAPGRIRLSEPNAAGNY